MARARSERRKTTARDEPRGKKRRARSRDWNKFILEMHELVRGGSSERAAAREITNRYRRSGDLPSRAKETSLDQILRVKYRENRDWLRRQDALRELLAQIAHLTENSALRAALSEWENRMFPVAAEISAAFARSRASAMKVESELRKWQIENLILGAPENGDDEPTRE